MRILLYNIQSHTVINHHNFALPQVCSWSGISCMDLPIFQQWSQWNCPGHTPQLFTYWAGI